MVFSRLLEQMAQNAQTEHDKALLREVGEKFRWLVFLRLAAESHLWFPDLRPDITLEEIVYKADLTPKEALLFIALHKGFISHTEETYYCSHQELAEAVWPEQNEKPVDINMTLSQNAKRLREKILAAGLPFTVENKKNVGYRLVYTP